MMKMVGKKKIEGEEEEEKRKWKIKKTLFLFFTFNERVQVVKKGGANNISVKDLTEGTKSIDDSIG